MRQWLLKITFRVFGFNFVIIKDGAVFLARDERALNCAVRDYVESLDNGRTEV